MLKEQFITQSTPDIRRKLQKLTLGPNTQLEEFLKTATSTFYNQDQEEKEKAKERNREKESHSSKKQAQLLAALKVGQPTPGHPRIKAPERYHNYGNPRHEQHECLEKRNLQIPYPKCSEFGHWEKECLKS